MNLDTVTDSKICYWFLREIYNVSKKWAANQKWTVNDSIGSRMNPALKDVICAATDSLIAGDNLGAYKIFSKSKIDEVNPEIVSYYLHLTSYMTKHKAKAVILDKCTSHALWHCLSPLDQLFKKTVLRKKLLAAGIITDQKNFTVQWNGQAYCKYIKLVNSWAETLGCLPQQIDLALLKSGREGF